MDTGLMIALAAAGGATITAVTNLLSNRFSSKTTSAATALDSVLERQTAQDTEIGRLQERVGNILKDAEKWFEMWQAERTKGEENVDIERKKAHAIRNEAQRAVAQVAQLTQLLEDKEREHAAAVARMMRDLELERDKVAELKRQIDDQTKQVQTLQGQILALQKQMESMRAGA